MRGPPFLFELGIAMEISSSPNQAEKENDQLGDRE